MKVPQHRAGNKYGVAPKAERTLDGIVFDSKGEMERWAALSLLQRAGEIVNLLRQVTYSLDVNGVHICNYIADFEYRERSDSYGKTRLVVEDWKGFKTPAYHLKKKLMLAIHGIKDIRGFYSAATASRVVIGKSATLASSSCILCACLTTSS